MADEYDTATLTPYATKQETHDWFSTASEGQKEAMGKIYKAMLDYKQSPQNAWFGQSINPANLERVLRGYARDYGLNPEALRMATYNLVPK